MTAQEPDVLDAHGQTWRLLGDPASRYLAERGLSFVAPHTGNWRGYVARWEVREGRLWLVGVRGSRTVERVVSGLTGLLILPPDVLSAKLSDCRGLVFAPADGDPLPVSAGEPGGAWFVSKDRRVAARLTDQAMADALVQHRAGHLVIGAATVKLAKATVLPANHAAPAEQLDSLSAELRPDAVPMAERWLPDDGEVWHGFTGYPEERLSGYAWFRVTMPPPVDGRSPDPGPPSWPVEQLLIRRTVLAEEELTDVGGNPLPIAADFVSGTLRLGRGRITDYVHADFESRYEHEQALTVRDGVVVDVAARPPTPTYVFRAFFDPGSDVMLWADNDATQERWDYDVMHGELPIPPALADRITALVDEFNDHNPDIAGKRLPDTPQWRADFTARYAAVLADLRRALGPDYQIVDAMRG